MDSTYSPDANAPAQPAPPLMPAASIPESYQTPPSVPVQPQPQPEGPRLDALIKPPEGETKPTTKMAEAAMELSKVTANDRRMQDEVVGAFGRVSEKYLESLLPAEKNTASKSKPVSDPQTSSQ